MSNFQDESVDNAQNTNQNQTQEPDMDDPGMPEGALQPLSEEEKERLERETEDMIHQQPGSHEGQAGQDELENRQQSSDYGQGGISNDDANQGVQGMDVQDQDADIANSGQNDYAGAQRDGGIGGTAAAGGVAGFDAGPNADETGDNVGTQNQTDAETGYGISESGTGGGIDGIGQAGMDQRSTGSPTAGGASAGANTGGIGQGTTDFDEEDSGSEGQYRPTQ
jgi:hypothetical protein